jgi:hypothetical protein
LNICSEQETRVGIIFCSNHSFFSDCQIRVCSSRAGVSARVRVLSLGFAGKHQVRCTLIIPSSHIGSSLFYYHRGVLLSDASSIISMPELELGEGKIKAGHGSVITSFVPQVMTYLSSRAVAGQEAKNMLYQGYIDEMITYVFGV